MIQLWGEQNSREYQAGQTLKDRILRLWPDAATNSHVDIRIIANVQCHGQEVQDIDLLIIAQFAPGTHYQYSCFLPFTQYREVHSPDYIYMRSLCLAIEVKDNAPENVRFYGAHAEVFYKNTGWHNATSQNEKQIYAVQGYLKSRGISAPWVTPLLWLRQVTTSSLPPRPHNFIGTDPTWELILNVATQKSSPDMPDDLWTVDAFGKTVACFESVASAFTRRMQPTRLDRLRMERLNQAAAQQQRLDLVIGKMFLQLRGRGGTGKTICLLQLAKYLYDEQDARILILTYNRALAKDLQRLLMFCGVRVGLGNSSIRVQTTYSYFRSVFDALGTLPNPCNDFLERYEEYKQTTLQQLRDTQLSHEQLRELTSCLAEPFTWEYVFVDEGQDWPQDEQDLLALLFQPQQLVVAIGPDQLVREQTPTRWMPQLQVGQKQVVSLETCLRMKAGLTRFVLAFADALGLPQTGLVANDSVGGGKVVIADGDYFAVQTLHQELIAANSEDKNSPVDMLFCIPPSFVPTKGQPSLVARLFSSWGYSVWDGTDLETREGYAEEPSELRIVQYDSCRGLEGWITVNLAFDDFYHYKLQQYSQWAVTNPHLFTNESVAAHLYAARWAMIPLTRAMDTLVIQLQGTSSPVRDALRVAADACPGIAEWRVL